jgi:hypothetical protein
VAAHLGQAASPPAQLSPPAPVRLVHGWGSPALAPPAWPARLVPPLPVRAGPVPPAPARASQRALALPLPPLLVERLLTRLGPWLRARRRW